MARWRIWQQRKPTVDERAVGITFIDVLFALVVSQIIDPIAQWGELPGVGQSQLMLAAVLAITSWIGYHNSWNRPHYFIYFPNLPLFQFLIDATLVLLYWLTTAWAEGTVEGVDRGHSALPEAVLVTLSFGLYVAWDWVGLKMREDPRYTARPKTRDVPHRRYITGVCFAASGVLLAVVYFCDFTSDTRIVVADMLFVAIILAFRFWKDLTTDPGSRDGGSRAGLPPRGSLQPNPGGIPRRRM